MPSNSQKLLLSTMTTVEERAKIPPGIPREGPTISYWQDPPSDIADYRTSQDLPATVDHIIVGSGISGAFIAYNLLTIRPNATVLLLEARQTCSGATGRNGGHTKAASYREFLVHEREFGLDEAVRIAKLEYDNIIATHAFARENNIKCASKECQTVDVCYSKREFDYGVSAVNKMREAFPKDDPVADYKIHDPDTTAKDFLCPGSVGSIEYLAGSLSAYDFAIGVLKLCLHKGLKLQTNTPAESIVQTTPSDSGSITYHVSTPRGKIATTNLILATNGYTAHLLPSLQGLIVPLHGQVIAKRPGMKMPQQGLPTTYSFIQETGYEYMISRPPAAGDSSVGDIVIGGGIWKLGKMKSATRYGDTDDTVIDPTIRDYLRESCIDYFSPSKWGEDNPKGRVKKEWSGVMGASADGLPYIGEMPSMPGLWISASFNGHGMVWCLKAAEALVERMLGGEEAMSKLNEWFPKSAWISEERMKVQFEGRTDLKAPEERVAINGHTNGGQ